MKRILLIILLLALGPAENNATDFMETGLSARAMAMGNAMTAGGHGIETVAHNPATLALNTAKYEFSSGMVNNFDMVERKSFGFATDKFAPDQQIDGKKENLKKFLE